MLLAVDIGNSSVKFGVFDGDQLVTKFSVDTKSALDEAALIGSFDDRSLRDISKAIACSVVPNARRPLSEFVSRTFGIPLHFVSNQDDLGLKIKYENLDSLGTDRVVNAFAAASVHSTPCIVCSLGTATTIDAVTENDEFLSGVIAPGMRLMANSLHSMTAQLPLVDIAGDSYLPSTSTDGAIRAGIFYGAVDLLDGIVRRLKNVTGADAKVIATGGFSELISSVSDEIDVREEDLTLLGLRLISYRDDV